MKIGQSVKVLSNNELNGQHGVVIDKYLGLPLVYFSTLPKGMGVGKDFLHTGNVNEKGKCFYIQENELEDLSIEDIRTFVQYHSEFKLNKEIEDFICNIIKISRR